MVEAWRIVKTKYIGSAFTGEGASLEGGRWNSAGTSLVYTSSSASLALLETLVNLESVAPLPSYSLFRIQFEEALVEALRQDTLPPNWLLYPPPIETQEIGDRWVAEARSAVLAVPSTLVLHELNYLLNASHPAFARVIIGPPSPFQMDPRVAALIGAA